jgi:hypothetical protein
VSIYRQNWQGGKPVGQPQVALKLPFAFPLTTQGNAYDFSRNLATVVYAPRRPRRTVLPRKQISRFAPFAGKGMEGLEVPC